MRVVTNSIKAGLAAAALVVICSAHVSLAGYKNMMNPTNTPTGPGFVGSASASLGYSLSGTNAATTPNNVKFNPSAGVSVSGTWTATAAAPGKSPAGCTSQIYVNTALPGGPKVVTYASTPSGAAGLGSAGLDPDLADRLSQDGFVLTPNLCNASYNVVSGDEMIGNPPQHYLVVLGTSTAGTAHWFRGYFFNGDGPTDRDQVIAEGTKLYDVVVTGPFDFGDPNSSDRCYALKIPINYMGPDLYLISDGASISTTDLKIVNCPSPVTLAACNPSYPTNNFTTSGGCGGVVVTFDTDPNSILQGASAQVTAMATDAAGNNATCTFTASRPAFLIVGAPTTTYPLSACNPSYPALTTSGGCAPIGNIIFNPASASSIAYGTLAAPVTATVTDANGTVATTNFMVSRAQFQFVNCPTGPLDFSSCGSPVAYPQLSTSGGCAPVTITFNPTVNALVPGNNTVIATAKDANGISRTCQFQVIRPYLSLGKSGYAPPIGGLGGSCAAPLRVNNSGNTLKIAFSTFLCSTAYNTIVPKITITKLDPTNNCQPTGVIVNQQSVTLINSQWHYNWSTGGNLGYFLISVDLGDGNPNPAQNSAIVLMQ